MMSPLSFGLVGCGHHGRAAVIPAMRRCDAVRLAAVSDLSPANLAAVEGADIGRFSSVKEMLGAAKLDAVYVATPVDAHAEAVIEALNAGCHVITEKPMAMSVDECRAMLAAAEAAGKTLAVDFESRSIPHYRRIRQCVDQGLLGAVRAVHIDHFWDGHKPQGELGERRRRFLDRSGCLDCGIHKIDLARYFSGGGAWRQIHAVGSWFGEKTVFPPHISILATLDNGVMATINASFAFTAYIPKRTANPNYQNLAIVGEKGVIVHHHSPSGAGEIEIVCEQMSAIEPCHAGNHKSDIAELLGMFAHAVQRGEPLPPEVATGHDGLMAQICMDEANRQAVRSGDASIPAPGGA